MAHKVVFGPRAAHDLQNLHAYLMRYSEEVANLYLDELEDVIASNIAERPLTWQFFFVTGAPYRAYLFRLGRRTAYWIVYLVDEEQEQVNILRIWHAAQNPREFET
jgi:plasmid stabilization system protein ParE